MNCDTECVQIDIKQEMDPLCVEIKSETQVSYRLLV